MLLHRAPHPTKELRSSGTHPVEELHELPELPEGVVVPDDLRGLEPPTTPSGVHWLRWVAVVALAVVAAAVVLLVRGAGETEQAEPSIVMSPAAEIVQDEIDAAIAELRVEQQARGYYEDLYVAAYPTPAYQIIQNEIDHALNEQAVVNDILAYYEDLAARTG